MEYLHRKDKKKTSAREDFERRLLPKVREYLRKDFGKKNGCLMNPLSVVQNAI